MKQKLIKGNLSITSYGFAVWSAFLPLAQNIIRVECAQMVLVVMELQNSTEEMRRAYHSVTE